MSLICNLWYIHTVLTMSRWVDVAVKTRKKEKGKLTTPQVFGDVASLQCFVLSMDDEISPLTGA